MTRWIALSLLAASGCAEPPELVRADPLAQALVGDTVADHDIDTVWVYRRNGACGPSTANWNKAKMFPGVGSGPLSKYCRATFTGAGVPGTPPDLPGQAHPDRLAVAPMGATDASLAANTHSRTVPLDDLPTLNHPLTRVALLDSIPDGTLDSAYFANTPEFSDHGAQMAVLNRRLLCDDDGAADCAATQQAYLALSWKVHPVTGVKTNDPVMGGAIGSQGDLAIRIYNAVSDWEQDHAAGTVGNLVLNLSLGWHPDLGGGGTPSNFDPPVKSVYDALRYASCKGALVVSAAGNVGGQIGDQQKPLYPAAWEKFNAPNQVQCVGITGSPGPDPIGTATYARLVYGVGGVTSEHEPMGVTRPGSLPTHVAAGTHLAFQNVPAGALSEAISGTSASTAVVSASAAVVRAYAPDLTAPETMEKLRDGANSQGWTVPMTPEWPAAATPLGQLHVVSVCHSLRAACAGNACQVPVNNSHCVGDPPVVPLVLTGAAQQPSAWNLDDTDPVCTDALTQTTPLFPENDSSSCPTEELTSVTARPMTLPMPPEDPCEPHCTLEIVSGSAMVEIPLGIGKTMSDTSVTVKTATATRTAEVGKLIGGNTYLIDDTQGALVEVGETPKSAVLSYVLDGKTTVHGEEMVLVY